MTAATAMCPSSMNLNVSISVAPGTVTCGRVMTASCSVTAAGAAGATMTARSVPLLMPMTGLGPAEGTGGAGGLAAAPQAQGGGGLMAGWTAAQLLLWLSQRVASSVRGMWARRTTGARSTGAVRRLTGRTGTGTGADMMSGGS